MSNKWKNLRVFVAALYLTLAFAQTQARPRAQPPAESRVDINHATLDELMKVPGMTRTWAVRIVRFRPYRTKIDLIDHGIVTSAAYDRIKDYVVAHRNEE